MMLKEGYNTFDFICPSGLNNATRFIMDDLDRAPSYPVIKIYGCELIEHESSIIKDVTGYGHNGIVYGNPEISTDTARYSNSVHFSATNKKIKIANFPTSGFGNSYSFSWWAKISSVSPMHWGFSDGIRLNGMYTGRLWNTGDSSSNPLYNLGTTT